MADDVKPALTAEEWASWPVPNHDWLETTLPFTQGADGVLMTVHNSQEVGEIHPEDRHKAAALCLYQQPFGFTDADVVQLTRVARWLREDGADDYATAVESVASRIAALLPPTP